MAYLNRFTLLIGLGLFALAGCGGDGTECGVGTEEMDGVCVPTSMICADSMDFNPTTRQCEYEEGMGAECGAGTMLMGDECVPVGESAECGAGTVMMGTQCVPDGSVICTGNTLFDDESGTCVVDPEAICEGDAVFVEDSQSCVDRDSTLEGMADIRELMEPNDPNYNEMGMPQMVDVSSDDPTSIWGCIRPTDFDDDGTIDPDLDFFALDIPEAGTVLDVTIDGTGGLAAGVAFFSVEDDLIDAGWERDLASLTTDGASGKVFFPEAGVYFMAAFDSRFLFTGAPSGSPTPETSCYFLQIQVGDDLTPVDVTPGTPVTGTFGDPVLYRTTGGMNDLLFGTLEELNADGEFQDNDALIGAFVQVVEGQFAGNAEGDAANPAFNLLGNMGDDDEVWFVVDYRLNLSFDETDFRFTLEQASGQSLPDDGDVTVTHQPSDPPLLTAFEYFYFEGNALDVIHTAFDGGGDDFLAFLVLPDGTALPFHGQDLLGFIPIQDFDDYIQLDQTGTHYFAIFNTSADEMTTNYMVNFVHTSIAPAMSVRDAATNLDLALDNTAFVGADLQAADWLLFESSNEVSFDGAFVSFYPRGEFGRLDVDVLPLDTDVLPNGGSFQRIPLGEGSNVLIRIDEDSGAVDGTETFDFTISDVPFTDLGTLTMDETRTGEMIMLTEPTRYVMRGEPLSTIDTLVTPTTSGLDPVIDILDPVATVTETIDDNGPDGTESFSRTLSGDGAIIFSVSDGVGAGGMFDIGFTITEPPYDFMGDSGVTFTSICPGDNGSGTEEMLVGPFDPTDDGQLMTPIDISGFGFLFFGSPVTSLDVFTNGWATFGSLTAGGFGDTFLGSPATVALDAIAPASVDINEVTICTLIDSETITVQWNGMTYSTDEIIQMQMILRAMSNRIDLVYGPDHSESIDASDIGGAWDPGPFFGLQRGSDGAQLAVPPVSPGQSISITPR